MEKGRMVEAEQQKALSSIAKVGIVFAKANPILGYAGLQDCLEKP